MIKNKSTDRGVSPVIGVVLMIGVTVILAAVVGSTVLDFSGDISSPAQGSVEFDENPNGQIDTTDDGTANTDVHTVEVQITNLKNEESVSIKAEDTDNTQADPDDSGSFEDYDPSVDTTVSKVGDIGEVSQLTDGDKVSVVVESEEGDTNVIQTHTVGE